MSVQIHTIKGNQYAYEHFRDGAKVRSVYLYPVNEGGKKRSSLHGGGAPVKSAAVDAKGLNSNRDNHSIGQTPKEIKNAMTTNTTKIETISIGENASLGMEKIIITKGGDGEIGILYKLNKNNEAIEGAVARDRILTDDEYDKFDNELRKKQKEFRPDYPIAIQTLEEKNISHLERGEMFYASGKTKENKEQIKTEGYEWDRALGMWKGVRPIHIKGVDIEKITTYDTKTQWKNKEIWERTRIANLNKD